MLGSCGAAWPVQHRRRRAAAICANACASAPKTGIYGARYVTADDVAKCVEAFNACIHGGASGGGIPGSTHINISGEWQWERFADPLCNEVFRPRWQ